MNSHEPLISHYVLEPFLVMGTLIAFVIGMALLLYDIPNTTDTPTTQPPASHSANEPIGITISGTEDYRPAFTIEAPPDYDVLNAVVNHPTLGNEREFLRIYDIDGNEYIDAVKLEPHQLYEVRMYYINDRPGSTKEINYAYGHINLPETVFELGTISGDISCRLSYPAPASITDDIVIRSHDNLRLTYVFNSGTLFGANCDGEYVYGRIDIAKLLTDKVTIGCPTHPRLGSIHSSSEPQYVSFTFFTELAETPV